jgi:hypothetical protein
MPYNIVDNVVFKKTLAGKNLTESKYLMSDGVMYPRYSDQLDRIKITRNTNQIIVKGDFEIEDELIFYKEDIFDKELIIDGGIFNRIIFRGGNFKKIVFRRCEVNGFVSIRGGTFENLVLLGGNFNQWLGLMDGIKNKDNPEDEDFLAEEPLIIKRFEIDGGSYAYNIWISGGEIDSLEIKSVSPIRIHCRPDDSKVYNYETNSHTPKYLTVPRIKKLIFSRYCNKYSFFQVSDLKLDNLVFDNFTNIGMISVAKVVLKSELTILNSDLGKTTLIDCDFSKQNLNFISSRILDLSLAGSKLPNPTNIVTKDSEQKRLALSQIKKIYENRGDLIEASNYQAEELRVYSGIAPKRAERINLWLNNATNNHGQSWWKPLRILLMGSAIFFCIYCLLLGFIPAFTKKG